MSEANRADNARNGNNNTRTSGVSNDTGSVATEVDELLNFLDGDSKRSVEGGEANNKTVNGDGDVSSDSSSIAADSDSLPSRTSPPYSSVKESSEEVDEGEYSPREKKLLERIEALTQEKLERSKTATESTDVSEVTESNFNFLDGLDIDEVLSSSDNLNKLLLGVYNKALQESSKLSAENIMRSLPSTMSNYVTQHLTMREMVNNFYDDNDDLVGAKQTVTDVANKIANDNPELTVEEVFQRTASEARKVLNLKKIEPKTKGKPTLHNSRGNGGRARLSVPELDGLAKEVNDLISD